MMRGGCQHLLFLGVIVRLLLLALIWSLLLIRIILLRIETPSPFVRPDW